MTVTSRPAEGLRHNPNFMRLWAAQAVSALGSRITRTALPVIAILTLDASASAVAMLAAMTVAPGVIVGLLAGGFIDRNPKRPMMIAADLIRAGLLMSVPVAAWFGVLTMAYLIIVAAVGGALSTLFDIADRSLLPLIARKDHILDGNAKLQTTDAIAESAGPALAGVLIQIMTAPVALIVDALSYVWSALMLRRIEVAEAVTSSRLSTAALVSDVRLGFAACLRHPLVGPVFMAEASRQFFNGIFFSLYMIVVLQDLALSPAVVGAIIGIGGIGALTGAGLAGWMRAALGPVKALAVAFVGAQAAAFLVPLSLVEGAPAIMLLGLQQLAGDAFLTAYLIYAISLRQELLPQDVLARSNAAFHVMTGVMVSLGAGLAVLLVNSLGTAALMWIAAIGGLAGSLLLAFAKSPDHWPSAPADSDSLPD